MTDKELAQEVVQRGSHKAFAEIVHRYSGMVFSKALGVMRTEEGAAEVTQQTFVRAYESLDAWRGTELAPWLTAIATHTALKLLDKERRRRTRYLQCPVWCQRRRYLFLDGHCRRHRRGNAHRLRHRVQAHEERAARTRSASRIIKYSRYCTIAFAPLRRDDVAGLVL